MATKRVTDERREKMSVRAARCYALHMKTPDVSIDNVYPDLLHDYTTDVNDLLHDYAALEAENERLRAACKSIDDAGQTLMIAYEQVRAENAAMRPIVEAVATSRSVFAELDVWVLLLENSTVSYLQELITQARAFVAAHPTDTAAATGEAESAGGDDETTS